MGITDNDLTKYYCTVVIAPFCVLQAIHTSNMIGWGGGGGGRFQMDPNDSATFHIFRIRSS